MPDGKKDDGRTIVELFKELETLRKLKGQLREELWDGDLSTESDLKKLTLLAAACKRIQTIETEALIDKLEADSKSQS